MFHFGCYIRNVLISVCESSSITNNFKFVTIKHFTYDLYDVNLTHRFRLSGVCHKLIRFSLWLKYVLIWSVYLCCMSYYKTRVQQVFIKTTFSAAWCFDFALRTIGRKYNQNKTVIRNSFRKIYMVKTVETFFKKRC